MPNNNKVAKPYWDRDGMMDKVHSHLECKSLQATICPVKITKANRRIEDILWEYDTDATTPPPDPKERAVFVCQKMPKKNSNGTINPKEWTVYFYNSGPKTVYINVYAKLYKKVGSVEIQQFASIHDDGMEGETIE
ncbi:hypothetical protein IAE22_25455 [Bacillus sp. S34]|nr:hypothetical protein [Bacillus sp. S34]